MHGNSKQEAIDGVLQRTRNYDVNAKQAYYADVV